MNRKNLIDRFRMVLMDTECGNEILCTTISEKMADIVEEQTNESKRLYNWLMDEDRQPAKTFFTEGDLRNVAREIEFRIKK